MTIIQLYLEHGVRQSFDNSSFDLNPVLFGHSKPFSSANFAAAQESIVMLVLQVGLQLAQRIE